MGFVFKCGIVLGIVGLLFWSEARTVLLAACCAVQTETAAPEKDATTKTAKSRIIRFVQEDGTVGYVDDPADVPPGATILEENERVERVSNEEQRRLDARREFERLRRQNLAEADAEGNWRTSANASADDAAAATDRQRAADRSRDRDRSRVSIISTGGGSSGLAGRR